MILDQSNKFFFFLLLLQQVITVLPGKYENNSDTAQIRPTPH